MHKRKLAAAGLLAGLTELYFWLGGNPPVWAHIVVGACGGALIVAGQVERMNRPRRKAAREQPDSRSRI
jgi:hypothetical protein